MTCIVFQYSQKLIQQFTFNVKLKTCNDIKLLKEQTFLPFWKL